MTDDLNAIHPLLPPVAGGLFLLLAVLIADLVARRIIVRAVQTLAKRWRATWDDALSEPMVIGRRVRNSPI